MTTAMDFPSRGTAVVDELLRQAIEIAGARQHYPESTYRVQFHAGFTFRDAAAIVPYLAELGVTHLYASPYLKAAPGSTHGYDVVDHSLLNPELGTDADFEALLSALRQHGMSHVLDTVPNHVGVATNENRWWNDVLENGPASRYGHYFDIAWRSSPRPELHDKVLLPLLGQPYAEVLEKGELKLSFEGGAFWVSYYQRRFPISPRTYAKVLAHDLERLRRLLPDDDPGLMEYLSVLTAARHLPDRSQSTREAVEERHREKEIIKRRLAVVAGSSVEVRQFIEANVAAFNGRPGDKRSFDLLDDLLSHQCYRLSYWHVASDEINYRRFFDINDLAALSMEREDVFESTHAFTLRLVSQDHLGGLRIDHPDGLYDPAQYFRRLQQHYVLSLANAAYLSDQRFQSEDWPTTRHRLLGRMDETGVGKPLYVTVEKILAVGEPLPESWPVHGTSGYDFLNEVNALFVDPAGRKPLTLTYEQFTGDLTSFEDLVYRKKLLILEASLASELHMLAHQLDRIAQADRRSRDFTFIGLLGALRQTIACFPVYRSYITDDGVAETDRSHVRKAIECAIARNARTDPAVFHFIRDTLLLEDAGHLSPEARHERLRFAGKFQQVTAPVTAKGIEDTAFYSYHRLISLIEVGGDPDRFGSSPEDLHRYLSDRQRRWPYALSALSTHDTKRSEDVRARINVLSEIPVEWHEHVTLWSKLNARLWRKVGDAQSPGPGEEYLLYQTLIGAWPTEMEGDEAREAFVKRIQAYMQKAMREAKVRTSWTSPNPEHEQAVSDFVAAILSPETGQEFLADFLPFQRRVARFGLLNSLSQTVLRLTAPGVPDTYQGTELLDFSLVDPDNRRPVDYAARRRMLNDPPPPVTDVLSNMANGRAKLMVTTAALRARRSHPGLFSAGDYLPARTAGVHADRLFAFARHHGDAEAVVAVPRFFTRLSADGLPPGPGSWEDTTVAVPVARPLRNLVTGERHTAGGGHLRAADVFATFPVAVLMAE